MARQNDRVGAHFSVVIRTYTAKRLSWSSQFRHACSEAHLTARTDDRFAHRRDDAGQLVRSDVRMRIDQDVR